MPEIQITNVVASASLGGYIDIDELTSQRTGGKILYESEQFPALIYGWKNPEVVFLVFSTGKIVCGGARERLKFTKPLKGFEGC